MQIPTKKLAPFLPAFYRCVKKLPTWNRKPSDFMDLDDESKSLEKACAQFRNKTWYIFRHAYLSEAAYREILQAMKTKDKIQNFILFQRKHDAFILHSSQRPSAIKCKCLFYNQLRPPVNGRHKYRLIPWNAASIMRKRKSRFAVRMLHQNRTCKWSFTFNCPVHEMLPQTWRPKVRANWAWAAG